MLLQRIMFALVFAVFAGAGAAHAQLSLSAGGGWFAPRGDSTAYVRNGLTGEAALELELGPHLALALGGAYTTYGLKASRLKADLGLPASDPLTGKTRLVDVTLAPKLYLLNHDIAAYVTLGGGPRWLFHRATSSTGDKTAWTEQAWGVMAGFGADASFDGFRVGFAPAYHRVNAERRTIEYMTFVFYIRI